MGQELTLEQFEKAYEIVKGVTLDTELVYSDYFSEQTGAKVRTCSGPAPTRCAAPTTRSPP